MNDRYLYRAKRKNWRELPKEMWWVEGYLYGIWERRYILWGMTNDVPNMVEVDPSTICQCTGLKDKNGKLIWESDVVEFEDVGEEGYEYKEGFDFINRAKVEFAEARWSLTDFISTNSSVVDEMYNHVEFMDFWNNCEVIGNIFDNPELLEVEE